MKIQVIALVALSLVLSGCGDTINGKSVAEPEVEKFHERLSARDFAAIYNAADPDFQKAVPKDKIFALFAAINRKLGHLQSTKEINWNVRTFNLTTMAVLVYQSTFADGEATETFTFRVSDGTAKLVGYNIGSLDMLIK